MRNTAKKIVMITVGCFFYALAFNLFLDPLKISPGGISGIAMVVKYIWGLPVGSGIILMNIPLFIAAYLRLGRPFVLWSMFATVVSSLMIDLSSRLPVPLEDLMLASICGGVFIGVGIGLIIRGGATTGGSDIISKLLQRSHPYIKMGNAVMLVEGVIIALSSVVFQDISLMIYAFIALYISGRVMNMILYGPEFAAMVYIISDQYEAIGDAIQDELGRGITYLDGSGGYLRTPKKVILCALSKKQVMSIRALVERLDPNAFLIITEGHQIIGDGFVPPIE